MSLQIWVIDYRYERFFNYLNLKTQLILNLNRETGLDIHGCMQIRGDAMLAATTRR